jgi:hypothetical protein
VKIVKRKKLLSQKMERSLLVVKEDLPGNHLYARREGIVHRTLSKQTLTPCGRMDIAIHATHVAQGKRTKFV